MLKLFRLATMYAFGWKYAEIESDSQEIRIRRIFFRQGQPMVCYYFWQIKLLDGGQVDDYAKIAVKWRYWDPAKKYENRWPHE